MSDYITTKTQRTYIRKFPKNVLLEDQCIFLKYQNYVIETPQLYHLKDVIVTNNKFKGIVLNGLKINVDSLPGFKNIEPKINLRYKLSTFFSSKKIYNDDTKVLMYNYWCNGYFHWLLDAIPRLYLLKDRINNYSLLFPEEWKDDNFHLKSFEPFNIEKYTFISDTQNSLKAKNLVMPSRLAPSGIVNPEIAQNIRELYLNYFKDKLNTNLGERIYITRKNAPKRKITNESEVIEYLTKYGFKTVDFQDYDFVEQISIASHTKIMISIHGAGLTNMLFMKESSYILELIHKEMKVLCYYNLADALNLKYLYQKCEPVDKQKSFFTSDIYVDVNELEKNIQQMVS